MYKKIKSTPRARFIGEPFVDGYTSIEKSPSIFTIGTSEETENIWSNSAPDYVTLLCRLSSKSEFPNVTISAGYRATPGGKDLIMQWNLYDGSKISMKRMVSEIAVEFVDFQTDIGQFNTEALNAEFSKNPVLYRKVFQIQNSSKRIPNYPDKTAHQPEIFMTKSDAYPFAGAYFDGIRLADIQPYLFYVGTGFRTEPYIKTVSTREALQMQVQSQANLPEVKICKDISTNSLSTLEDDICEGKIKINLDSAVYASISAQKSTLISSIFPILFKKVP